MVAAGTIPFQSVASGNTVTYQVQVAQDIALSDIDNIGLCAFDSSQFSVDANGFVSLAGGGMSIDSIAVQTGTSPIVPDGTGLVTINGAVVAAGTNPVRTDGTGANTLALEVQISQALAATDATKIGLAAFDSSSFTVDANGFVTFTASVGTITTIEGDTGTPTNGPVVPFNGGLALVTSNGLSFGIDGLGVVTLNFAYLNLPETTSGGDGILYMEDVSNRYRMLHVGNQGITANNVFVGPNSGNLSLIGGCSTNTALGGMTLNALTTGAGNTVMGFGAGALIDTGANNTGIGESVLAACAGGSSNIAVGGSALGTLNTGTNNVAVGLSAGGALTSGSHNTILGINTLANANGSYNIVIGESAGSALTGTDSDNLLIGNVGVVGDANTMRIGTQGTSSGEIDTTFIAGVAGVTVSNQEFVTIDTTTGQLGSAAPSGGGLTWTDVTGTSQAMAVENGYTANNTGLVTLVLPATALYGSVMAVVGKGAGGWQIAQNGGQVINLLSSSTTVGATGFLESTSQYDVVYLLCTVADTTFTVINSMGNITVS